MANQIYFQGAIAKLTIASVFVEGTRDELVVEAQYNPNELQISQPIGWAEHQNVAGQSPSDITLEFGGMKASTMQVELLFDGTENEGRTGTSKAPGPYVIELIAKLKKLATVRDPHSPDPVMRLPHFCIVTWGRDGVRPFRCVISSLTTKYQRFSSTGQVLRASVTVSLLELDSVQLTKDQARRSAA